MVTLCLPAVRMLEVPSLPTQPVGPRVAVVHNPYSFRAYDTVLVPEVPSAESTPCSTPCGTSSRSASPADFDAASRSTSHFDVSTPVFDAPPTSPTSLLPSPLVASSDAHGEPQHQLGSHSPPAPSPAAATTGLAEKTPALRWRRYGIRVSHLQALKDLQTFTRQHPVLEKPRVVWVGPCLPTSGPPAPPHRPTPSAAPFPAGPTASLPSAPAPLSLPCH
eukprot:EG_transcript_8445